MLDFIYAFFAIAIMIAVGIFQAALAFAIMYGCFWIVATAFHAIFG
jgi:hypothetical protein